MPISGANRHPYTQIETTVVGYTMAEDVCLKIPIAYTDISGVVATLPANCLIIGECKIISITYRWLVLVQRTLQAAQSTSLRRRPSFLRGTRAGQRRARATW
jgi:hypothetical protein